jgi:hypothetical protein
MGKRKYDWALIQKYYDEGHTYAEVGEKFGCRPGAFPRAIERGEFKSRNGRAAQVKKTEAFKDDRLLDLAAQYKAGASYHDLVSSKLFSMAEFNYARDNGYMVVRNKQEQSAMRIKKYGPSRHSEEFKQTLSERQSLHNSGGRCKWYWVGDQRVQGTWERDGGLKLTELGIEWRKCAGKADIIRYVLDDKERRYTPDFYLPAHDIYLEFKGFWWGDDRRKMDAVLSQSLKHIVILEKAAYLDLVHNNILLRS